MVLKAAARLACITLRQAHSVTGESVAIPLIVVLCGGIQDWGVEAGVGETLNSTADTGILEAPLRGSFPQESGCRRLVEALPTVPPVRILRWAPRLKARL